MARVRKDMQAFKRTYAETNSIKQAALSAGYSEHTSNMGLKPLPKQLVNYVVNRQRRMDKTAALARLTSAQFQEEFVRGRLIENALAGKDSSCNSLKLLGQDRRVNMFTPDQQLGIVNVVLQNKPDSVPVLDLPPEE